VVFLRLRREGGKEGGGGKKKKKRRAAMVGKKVPRPWPGREKGGKKGGEGGGVVAHQAVVPPELNKRKKKKKKPSPYPPPYKGGGKKGGEKKGEKSGSHLASSLCLAHRGRKEGESRATHTRFPASNRQREKEGKKGLRLVFSEHLKTSEGGRGRKEKAHRPSCPIQKVLP